jgi:superoxide dismutase, Fe-Mn family
VINGPKREELIATNSMILHELYFDGLGEGGTLDTALRASLTRDFGSVERWRRRALRIRPSTQSVALIDGIEP